MARALGQGFITAQLVSREQIRAADPSAEAREAFTQVVGAHDVVMSNSDVVRGSDVVFIAVKPQHVNLVFDELADTPNYGRLFVSIVAGVKLKRLIQGLSTERVVRVMPNTPCLVCAGAAGYCSAAGVSETDCEFVDRLLSAVGIAYRFPEALLDAVTGLSGSGPAFIFQVIEALSDGGVQAGLSRDAATSMAAQTVLGAAKMVLETGEHPAVLKDRVASPAGTTIAGLEILERGKLRATLMGAVKAAADRSMELDRDADE